MAKQSDHPYRIKLRAIGDSEADTMTESELIDRIYKCVTEGDITTEEWDKLREQRKRWADARLKTHLRDGLHKLTPELRNVIRTALKRFDDVAPATAASDDNRDFESIAAEMERKLKAKFGFDDPQRRESETVDETHKRLTALNKGAGAALMEMAEEAANATGDSRITYSKGKAMPTEQVDEVFIRVKGSNEQYRHTRHVLKHAKWERAIHPIRNGAESSQPVESLSEWETAKIGAWLKWKAAKAGFAQLNDHDRAVLDELFETDTFVGWDGEKQVSVKNVKALINDGTSGGQYLSPEYFDTRIVSFPLLHSELLPFVDIVDVPRGKSVETVSVGNPTVQWNSTEGSAANLFTTAGLVAQITATIFPVDCFLEIGRDMMNDSLPMIGAQLVENLGQRIAAELDEQITTGDGTTQPQGIMNASGTNNVTPAIPTTGPVAVGDLLEVMFAIGKQYRVPSWNPRYVMRDQRYMSHRALATGVTGDDRLLHGMDVQSYRLLEAPVSIENVGMQLDFGIFGAMKKYRLWRRAGFETRFEAGGATLARSNTVLLCGRGRYGGKVIDGNAFAVMTGWPTSV